MRQRKLDRHTKKAVRRFLTLIKGKCDVVKAIVFGSRARGDHHEESDADVAVLLRDGQQKTWDLRREISDLSFDVMLETGIHISTILIGLEEWKHPKSHQNPDLLKNIVKDGIRV